MQATKQEIEVIIKELEKRDENFIGKMKNKSFELGVISQIRNELNQLDTISIIDMGGDDFAWIEGSSIVKDYFNKVKKNSEPCENLSFVKRLGCFWDKHKDKVKKCVLALGIAFVGGTAIKTGIENNRLKEELIEKEALNKMIESDGLRNGSSLAGKLMRERRKHQ